MLQCSTPNFIQNESDKSCSSSGVIVGIKEFILTKRSFVYGLYVIVFLPKSIFYNLWNNRVKVDDQNYRSFTCCCCWCMMCVIILSLRSFMCCPYRTAVSMPSRIKIYMKLYRIMYIPLELQKHILSFLPLKQNILHHKTGRCICLTVCNRRCKNKVNYLKGLTCGVHKHIDFPELLAYISTKWSSYSLASLVHVLSFTDSR